MRFRQEKKRDFRLLPTLRQQLTKENKNREKKVLVLEVKRVQDRSVSSTFGYLKL